MTIEQIKSQLSILQVLSHYNLSPIKKGNNLMLLCPFHEDKNPSMAIYSETNTYHCFGCGSTGDSIQFIEDYEKVTKKEAIQKAKSLITNEPPVSPKTKQRLWDYRDLPLERLGEVFEKMRWNVKQSKKAQLYLKERVLDFEKLEVGYNAKSFKGITNCIVFPLRDKDNKVVSLYGRKIEANQRGVHYYLKSREGLYPSYPSKDTKCLLLTESIIDAASLLQTNLPEDASVLACYGVNGLNEEIKQAIKDWLVSEPVEEKEIVFTFDEDQAGKEAVKRYANYFREKYPKLLLSIIDLPNKDLNETLQLHSPEVFTELIKDRKSIFLEPKALLNEVSKNGEKSIKNALKNIDNPTNLNLEKLLKSPDLLDKINELIGDTGIVGEHGNRVLLFLIAISYNNEKPLHAIVKGSSGSGKTHLISKITDLMPREDVLRFTRITESSLYNWGEFDLYGKILLIEDLDGLKEEALYALREFISNQVLRSSVTVKDKQGNNRSRHKVVKGKFSSLSATTKGEIYEDNENRSFTINVDESSRQTDLIINYQNQMMAGEIDQKEQIQKRQCLQELVRRLKPLKIINPFATRLQLPENTKKKRRLNAMYMSIINQVAYLHQFQRERTKEEFILASLEDVKMATEIFFETIVLKVDELDGSLRLFYEKLKNYLLKSGDRETPFIQREVRQALNISKSQLQRYIWQLQSLDYIRQAGGHPNRGLKYKVSYWDDYHKIRKEIKEFMLAQIKELEKTKEPLVHPGSVLVH